MFLSRYSLPRRTASALLVLVLEDKYLLKQQVLKYSPVSSEGSLLDLGMLPEMGNNSNPAGLECLEWGTLLVEGGGDLLEC
jgi:hypothetical protein